MSFETRQHLRKLIDVLTREANPGAYPSVEIHDHVTPAETPLAKSKKGTAP